MLGLYTTENEGAKFWLSILTDLKIRGVDDILITCIDSRQGFPDAGETIFPKTRVQLCIVQQIRRFIYTANPIEGVHRQIRKNTKTKGAFSSEQALMKLMYLVIKNISKKWKMPIHNWGLAFSQLYIKFSEGILPKNRDF